MNDTFEAFWRIVMSVWSSAVFGVGVSSIIVALGIFILFLVLRGVFARFAIRFLIRLAKRTKTEFDDQLIEAIDLPLRFVFVVVGLFIAADLVSLPADIHLILTRLVRSLVAFVIFWTLYRIVRPLSFLMDRISGLMGAHDVGDSLKEFFVKVLKFAIACLGVAAFLEEWDFNVAAILGGLGLVGMALAFGAQHLISKVFAGVSIFLDRMFERGDWIRAADVEGTVEEIGFRSTRIRQFDKALVTIPNSVITSGAIRNFSQMTNRRIYWKLGLVYGASERQLRQVVEAIRAHVHETGEFETDPARTTTLINVDSFNDSSIDIMVYCFTKTTNWGEWMEIKQRFAFRVKEIVEAAGTSFAFPSASVYLENLPFGTPKVFPHSPQSPNIEN